MNLRPYQQSAIDALWRWFEDGNGNPLVVLPTGSGKSLVQAAFIKAAVQAFPETRILCLTHVRELIQQNHAQLLRLWPEAPAGIYSAGMGRREHDAQVMFGGIQSVHKRADRIGWADLVLIDEAHLIPTTGFGMYRSFLDAMESVNPHLKIVGLTATPFRTDSGSLDKGSDRLFHGTAYDADLLSLIADGYLSPITAKATTAEIDVHGVHKQGGEYIARELEDAAMAGENVERAVAEIVRRGHDRRAWLLFCCGVRHAHRVADELQKHSIESGAIFGSTPKHERDDLVERFKAGDLRAMVNVNVLTTGFDAPQTDLIAMLRPTCSPGLYVQMAGRGLRLAPGKANCLLLDFAGNVMRHGPLDAVRVREPGKGDGTPPVKRCENCDELVAISVTVCPECGFEFAVMEEAGPKHAEVPDELPVLSVDAPKFERWDVQVVRYELHQKAGKPPSMRVEYDCGFSQRVRQWVCFEHTGYAQHKARRWWSEHGGKLPAPATVAEALARAVDMAELWHPSVVTVDVRGEYPEIKSVRMERTEAGCDESEGVAPVSADTDEIPF